MTFAIIKTGGKQYKVAQGDVLEIEKLEAKDGTVEFTDVLLTADGDKVTIGTPMIAGAKVTATVLAEGKGEKKIVFKYKSKTRQHKMKGHRQPYTKVQITNIAA